MSGCIGTGKAQAEKQNLSLRSDRTLNVNKYLFHHTLINFWTLAVLCMN